MDERAFILWRLYDVGSWERPTDSNQLNNIILFSTCSNVPPSRDAIGFLFESDHGYLNVNRNVKPNDRIENANLSKQNQWKSIGKVNVLRTSSTYGHITHSNLFIRNKKKIIK